MWTSGKSVIYISQLLLYHNLPRGESANLSRFENIYVFNYLTNVRVICYPFRGYLISRIESPLEIREVKYIAK